jgi:hypothetical protein
VQGEESIEACFLVGLLNPKGQRQTSTLSIPRDNYGERKAKFH